MLRIASIAFITGFTARRITPRPAKAHHPRTAFCHSTAVLFFLQQVLAIQSLFLHYILRHPSAPGPALPSAVTAFFRFTSPLYTALHFTVVNCRKIQNRF
jgi:hypothetical protein